MSLLAIIVSTAVTTMTAAPASAAVADDYRLVAGVFCEGRSDIWVMNPDGSAKSQLIANATAPAVSPDGSHLAFVIGDGVSGSQVMVGGRDGTGAVLVGPGDTSPSWSPDGAEVVMQHDDSNTGISFLQRVQPSQGLSTLTGIANSSGATSPAWGPTGQIAFTLADVNAQTSRVYGVSPAGVPSGPLSPAGGRDHFPSWSSDGRLAYSDDGQLMIRETNGNISAVGSHFGAQWSAWRPDGGRIAYSAGSGSIGLYAVNPDGSDGQAVWDWNNVPEYPQQGDCGQSVSSPSWQRITASPVDTTAPTLTCAGTDGLWHQANIALACTASDSGSGLADSADAAFTLATSVPVGTETSAAATGTRDVCDVAGNCVTAGPLGGNEIDRRGPTVLITTPAEGDVIAQGATVLTSFACSDAGSGVSTCAGPGPSGQLLDTNTPGSHTLTVTGTDAVGNATTASHAFTVTAAATNVLSIGDVSVSEGNSFFGAVMSFRVTMSQPASVPVTVRVSPRAVTAHLGSDYLAFATTIRLRQGQLSQNFSVLVIGDRVPEPDEVLTATLSAPVGATIGRAVAQGVIRNDD